ncbi:DnaB-like helicase N-terminal domain-containing protein [Streptomyces sp. NPDC059578]|uniref:DnaB-like helicase N-terminal domain-containing protein n=1 Tax=Streptomyces sp. NPDC059578 TaxID=3346874 RepID=UPI0036C0E257
MTKDRRQVAPGPATFRSDGFVSRNRLIYEAITDLSKAGKPVDVAHVAAELERRDQLDFCGGEDYLFECVKIAIKGAYEAGMNTSEFASSNARKMQAAARARQELLTSVLGHSSVAESAHRASRGASKLHSI